MTGKATCWIKVVLKDDVFPSISRGATVLAVRDTYDR